MPEKCETEDINDFDTHFQPGTNLKLTYRELALKCHPDKCGENKQKCTENFQKLQASYEAALKRQEDEPGPTVVESVRIEPQYLQIIFTIIGDKKQHTITFRSIDDIKMYIQWSINKYPCSYSSIVSSWKDKFCNIDDFTKVTECTDPELLMKLYIFHGHNAATSIITGNDLGKFFNAFLKIYNDLDSLRIQLQDFKRKVPLFHETKGKFGTVKQSHTVAKALVECVETRIKELESITGGKTKQARKMIHRRRTKKDSKKAKMSRKRKGSTRSIRLPFLRPTKSRNKTQRR